MTGDTRRPEPPWNEHEWMTSRDARGIRMLAEFLGPQSKLINRGITDTIVFFGSARTDLNADDTRAATELSTRLSKWALTPREQGGGARPDGTQRFHICSGGGPGIMEAANLGAHNAKAANVGLGIELPSEPGLNQWITEGLDLQFKYFAMRKFWFIYPAKAIIVFPGGFGTLDELFEILTLIQTKKISKNLPIILWNEEFWQRLINWEMLVETGMISSQDLDLMVFTSDIDHAESILIEYLKDLPEVSLQAP